jgi:DNA-binding transcriptional regulator PaaX
MRPNRSVPLVMAVLADADRELYGREVAAGVPFSYTSVYSALARCRNRGWVAERHDGNRIWYRLTEKGGAHVSN